MELIRWAGEDVSPDKDGSITKSILEHGEKYANATDFTPLTGKLRIFCVLKKCVTLTKIGYNNTHWWLCHSAVRFSVDIIGYHNEKVFLDKKDLKFSLGEAADVGLPEGAFLRFNFFEDLWGNRNPRHVDCGPSQWQCSNRRANPATWKSPQAHVYNSYVLSILCLCLGVDKALAKIYKGEKAQVQIRGQSPFSYGTTAPAEYGLPANADLEFTIHLKDYEKVSISVVFCTCSR